ncbi:MAG: helix-hairpin-helix domain-containing protein [Bacteroidota bacterium]
MDSIRNFFSSELFTAPFSDDSLTVLGAFLALFLLGWILRYFWDRWKIKSLEESLEKSKRNTVNVQATLTGLQEQYALQEADLKKANLELADKSKGLEVSEAEKRTLNSRLNATLVDLEKSKEEFQEVSSRMEDLNDQILGLRTKNAQLNTEVEQVNTGVQGIANTSEIAAQYEKELSDLMSENTLLKNSLNDLKSNLGADGTAGATVRLAELEEENNALKAQLDGSSTGGNTAELEAKIAELEAEKDKLEDYVAEIAQLEAGNEVLNNSVQTLVSENDNLQLQSEEVAQYEAGHAILTSTIADLLEKNESLRQQLSNQEDTQIEWAVGDDDLVMSLSEEDADEIDVEAAKASFRAAIGNQIAAASASDKDDLKQINGVGPFIEEKLNELGIYTFEQVSQLDEELIETLTNAIEFFPGRIERDDWVGQADRLFYNRGNRPQDMAVSSQKIITRRYATATEKIEVIPSANARSVVSVKPDDLKKIEGIGPKIAQILNEAGIYTFSNLSQTSAERLKSILAAAGNRYKMHNPDTWAEQAKLAAAGDWDALKVLQDRLDGGRDTAKG